MIGVIKMKINKDKFFKLIAGLFFSTLLFTWCFILNYGLIFSIIVGGILFLIMIWIALDDKFSEIEAKKEYVEINFTKIKNNEFLYGYLIVILTSILYRRIFYPINERQWYDYIGVSIGGVIVYGIYHLIVFHLRKRRNNR
jgi:hypothetical protein